jgi:hypothetical protein
MNTRFSKTKGVQPKSAAIYSAALQDHFMKKFASSIDMDISGKKKPEQRRKTVTKLPSIKNIQSEKIK